MPEPENTAPILERIGNYEILEEIGHGGMGIIYRARELSLGRTVALKVLREDLRSQSALVARFRREAQAAALLNHPNIAQIYSVGTADGIPYIAMQFIDGVPLSAIMQQEGPLPWERAFHIAEQVARALACAHTAHVIHRDIKPPNILIDEDDRAFVTDFGIAKILTLEEQLTIDGTRLGTPHYMAPERCKKGEVTAASDIYSLGVLLFQMISGRLPYEAPTSVELVRKILSEPPARLRSFVPHVPESVERLVAYLIEKKPSDRPASAEKVCAAIALVRAGKPLDQTSLSMTSALAEFRKTDTPRPSYVKEDATTKLLVGGPVAQFTFRWFGTPHPWHVFAALVLLVAAGTGLGVLVANALREDPHLVSARSLDADLGRWRYSPSLGRFIEEAPGVLLVHVSLSDFAFHGAHWSYGNAFVLLTGEEQGRRSGQRMICSLDPSQKRIRICVPPFPALDGSPPSASPRILSALRYAQPDSLWNESVFIRYTELVSGNVRTETSLLVCPPVASALEPPALFSDPVAKEKSEPFGIVPERIAALDVRPDGKALAMGLTAPDQRAYSVVEARLLEDRTWEVQPLVHSGDPLLALQYAPNGSLLACLSYRDEVTQQLRVISLEGNLREETLLTEGGLNLYPGAFAPTNDAIVLSRRFGDEPHEILILPLDGENPEPLTLAEGFMPTWHPSGVFVVAVAPDRKGQHQLFAVETNPPHRRRQLTHLDKGVAAYCAVAGSGSWALAPLPHTPEPVLAFADLSRVSFN